MTLTQSTNPKLEGNANELASLLEVAKKVGATLDLESLIMEIQKAALPTLGCERVTLFLYDAKSDELWSRFATGTDEIRFPASAGIAGETLRSGHVVNVPDAYKDARFNHKIDDETGFRTRSILSVPMFGYDGAPVGVLQVLNKADGHFTSHDEGLAETFCSLTGVAIQRQLLLNELEEKQKMMLDLEVARDIQQSFLPDGAPSVDGYDIAGWNRPADETGGDCYDFIEFPGGHTGFLLADATGHGIGPALMASQCRALVQGLVAATGDISETIDTTNRILNKDLKPGLFLTVFLGYLDAEKHQVHYVSGGQAPLLHYKHDSRDRVALDASTTPLGMLPFIDATSAPAVEFGPGDVFFLASDGFFEWANPDEEEYGVDRVFDVIEENPGASSAEIIELVRVSVSNFARGVPQGDDLTAVVIKRHPNSDV